MPNYRINFAWLPKQMSDKSWILLKRYISYYTDNEDGEYPEKALNYLGVMVDCYNKPLEVYRITYKNGKHVLDNLKSLAKMM